MTDIAACNRAIKKTLGQAFGRGTGYGYVRVRIDYTPRDWEQAQELQGLCKALLRKSGIDLGFSYTDDTCQFKSDQCSIEFNRSRFRRVFVGQDTGQLYGKPWDSDEWIPAA